jgi:cation:H+ antiporter
MQGLMQLSVPLSLGLFVLAGAAVWWAGSRLSVHVAALADRTGMSQGFAGMLLLGGITSLPEVATAGSAGLTGSPDLAVSNLSGTASINILLLVVADILVAGAALTALARSSSPLLQGVLGMLLMAGVGVVAVVGEREIPGTSLGFGTTGLLAGCVGALWLASQYEKSPGWTVRDDDGAGRGEADDEGRGDHSTGSLILYIVVSAAVILGAGSSCRRRRTGSLRRQDWASVLLGLCSWASPPPFRNSALSAPRSGSGVLTWPWEMSWAPTFLTSRCCSWSIWPIATGRPWRMQDGLRLWRPFLALAVMGLFIAGLLARHSRTLFRLSTASWGVVVVYAAGLSFLAAITDKE